MITMDLASKLHCVGKPKLALLPSFPLICETRPCIRTVRSYLQENLQHLFALSFADFPRPKRRQFKTGNPTNRNGLSRPASSPEGKARNVLPSSSFANHLRRPLVIAPGDEGAMPQVPGTRPFDKRDLADQLRGDPAALRHFLCSQRLAPPGGPFLRQIPEVALGSLQRLESGNELITLRPLYSAHRTIYRQKQ
jgi:hypothetical protein